MLALFIALSLTAPAILLAHAKLVRSDPADGATLTASPSEILLVFTEAPALALSRIRLVTPAGDTTLLQDISHHSDDEHVISAEISNPLTDGHYTILWRVAGNDGHASSGAIGFDIAAAVHDSTPVATTADSRMKADERDTGTIAVAGALGAIVARWLSFISIFLVAGAVAFRYLVIPRMTPSSTEFEHVAAINTATLGLITSVAGILASMLKLVRESADMPDASLRSLLLGSMWGVSLLLQIVAFIMALAAFARVHRAMDSLRSSGWVLALASAALLCVSPSLGGHAVAGDTYLLAVPTDILHVAAGSLWIGTLAVILLAGIPAVFKSPDEVWPGARVASMINVFSPLALTCGGAVVATGVGSSVLRLPSVPALWTSPYGVILLFKLFFVAMLFGAGAWNWRRMKPRLTGDNAVAPLRSSATFELVLAVAVLGITAVLVALELP